MGHLLWVFYGWPNGLVWSNILAEPIIAGLTALILYLFRNWWMKRFVAFHHKHKEAHRANLEPRG